MWIVPKVMNKKHVVVELAAWLSLTPNYLHLNITGGILFPFILDVNHLKRTPCLTFSNRLAMTSYDLPSSQAWIHYLADALWMNTVNFLAVYDEYVLKSIRVKAIQHCNGHSTRSNFATTGVLSAKACIKSVVDQEGNSGVTGRHQSTRCRLAQGKPNHQQIKLTLDNSKKIFIMKQSVQEEK